MIGARLRKHWIRGRKSARDQIEYFGTVEGAREIPAA